MPAGSEWCEIDSGRDFWDWSMPVDWLVSNPPYSCIDAVLEHSARLARKGFGYLLGINNLTPRRIEAMDKAGFGITKVHLCKVFKFYGMSAFVLWQRNHDGIVGYDRVVWRGDD